MIKLRKITAFMLSLLVLITCGSNTAFASELDNPSNDGFYVNTFDNDSDIALYYTNIDSISASIKESGAKAYLSTTVVSKKKNNIKIVMCLERLDGSYYKPVANWDKTGNDTVLEVSASRVINVLKKYRLRSVVTIGNESVTVYRYL